MSVEIILALAAVGIAAGILSGIFGVGGGIIIVPSLITLYAITHPNSEYVVQAAIATSLFTIIFTSISSTYKHSKNNNVVAGAAVYIGLSSAVTVFFFSKLAVSMPQDILKKIFIAIFIISAIKMLFDRKKSDGDYLEEGKKYNKLICILIGFLTGAVAAFTGLGGAIFAVPLMHYLMKIPFKKSIGTSTMAILITSIAGTISYLINSPAGVHISDYSVGMVDIGSALPIVAASIPFAQLGVHIHNKMDGNLLTKLFAGFILLICLKMIFF